MPRSKATPSRKLPHEPITPQSLTSAPLRFQRPTPGRRAHTRTSASSPPADALLLHSPLHHLLRGRSALKSRKLRSKIKSWINIVIDTLRLLATLLLAPLAALHAADAPKLLPPEWNPALAGDIVLQRLVKVTRAAGEGRARCGVCLRGRSGLRRLRGERSQRRGERRAGPSSTPRCPS